MALRNEEITEQIIGAAIEVHRHLGPGLLESAYRRCLVYELGRCRVPVASEVPLDLVYKGVRLGDGYRLDLVVADEVIVELKVVDQLLPIHQAQLLTYMRLSEKPVGLLLNFHVKVLKDGIRRLVL